MCIQKWWREVKIKPQPMIIAKPGTAEEKKLKNNLLIELEEGDYEDAELSSMEDSDAAHAERFTTPASQVLTRTYNFEPATEFVHTSKKSEDEELEEVLEREYKLSEYRLYVNSVEEHRNCPWSFYPVVSEYPAYQNTMKSNSVPYHWNSIIMPYYDQSRIYRGNYHENNC